MMEQHISPIITEIDHKIQQLKSELDSGIANGNSFIESKAIYAEIKELEWKKQKLLQANYELRGNRDEGERR